MLPGIIWNIYIHMNLKDTSGTCYTCYEKINSDPLVSAKKHEIKNEFFFFFWSIEHMIKAVFKSTKLSLYFKKKQKDTSDKLILFF